jgi:hypothetical protein
MSAVIEQAVDFKNLNDELLDTSTGKKIREASATRWVWQPFKDIPLFDNLGACFLNSLTIVPEGEKRAPVQALRRCQPYPLSNCEY